MKLIILKIYTTAVTIFALCTYFKNIRYYNQVNCFHLHQKELCRIYDELSEELHETQEELKQLQELLGNSNEEE